MPNEVRRISKNYMQNPFEITVGKENSSADNIEHQYYMVSARDRYLALKRIVDYYPEIFGIVFCRTKAETQDIAEKLIKDGYNADALHGDLSQAQRDYVMNRYRNRHLQILVATDVAARGIDVDSVTHVINFNLPDDVESYTHRSGRTARAGKSGISLAILIQKEFGKIREIERNINKRFTLKRVPNGDEVCEKQLFHLVKNIHDAQVNEEDISDYLPPIMEMLKDLSKEDLIKKMVSTDFNRFLDYYRDAPDLNMDVKKQRDPNSTSNHRGEVTGRFFINIGEMDGLDKLELRDFVVHCTGMDKNEVGKIDVKDKFSFFEVDPKIAPLVIEGFQNKFYNQRRVRIEVSEGRSGGSGGGRSYGGGSGRSGGSYGGGKRYGGGDDRGGFRGDRGGDRGGDSRGGGRGFGSKSSPSYGGGNSNGGGSSRRRKPF
jgi:ATP-dependent RNA helicase DeaD